MIGYPGMLVKAAKKAGMKVPEDPNKFKKARETHPHFFVFCMVQLQRPMNSLSEHWDNARIIAELSDEEIENVTLNDLLVRGLSFSV